MHTITNPDKVRYVTLTTGKTFNVRPGTFRVHTETYEFEYRLASGFDEHRKTSVRIDGVMSITEDVA